MKKQYGSRLGFIILDYKPKQHLTYDEACAERKRLSEIHKEKDFRIMKVVNANGAELAAFDAISAALEEGPAE